MIEIIHSATRAHGDTLIGKGLRGQFFTRK
jgi:hypothetical protein